MLHLTHMTLFSAYEACLSALPRAERSAAPGGSARPASPPAGVHWAVQRSPGFRASLVVEHPDFVFQSLRSTRSSRVFLASPFACPADDEPLVFIA